MSIIFDNLASFAGTGMLLTLFLICVLYLAFMLENGVKKHILVWLPIFVLVIYFCPVWAIYNRIRDDSEILYRLLWLLPMGIVICYTIVDVIGRFDGKSRVCIAVFSILVLVISGDYIYDNSQYTKAENIYHVPQVVVEICDLIEVPGREVRACFPDELIQYVRQYTAITFLPYGRSVFMQYGSDDMFRLRDILQEEIVDSKELANELRNTMCHYIIIDKGKILTEDLVNYDYSLVGSLDRYDIYVDNFADLSLNM